jgi:hypothetical protein
MSRPVEALDVTGLLNRPEQVLVEKRDLVSSADAIVQ